MKFTMKESKIAGCYELTPHVFEDARGRFIKTYHSNAFTEVGLEADYREEYYSVSRKGVLRGLHFQLPPHDHTKLVYCVEGEVMDVVVDLRVNSPTYGQYEAFELNSLKSNMIYIPSGLAHGFLTLSERAILLYKVTTEYHADSDSGIRWDSVGIRWPIHQEPIISERDRSLISLDQFHSPFRLKEREL